MKQSIKVIFENVRLILLGLLTAVTGLNCLFLSVLIFVAMLIVGMCMKAIEFIDRFRTLQHESLKGVESMRRRRP